jgi:hypothetical protein
MNDQKLENKVRKDAAKVKKDIGGMVRRQRCTFKQF